MNTRYIFDPQPDTSNLNDILWAMVAVYPPLYSLDIIPERLRYMFREEVVLQCGTGGSGPTSPGAGGCAKVVIGPIKNCKVALTGDAVKADDEATISALIHHGQWDGGFAPRSLLEAIRRGEVPGLTTIDKCSDLINEHARAMNERDTLKAEVERMRASESAQLAQARGTVKALQSEVVQLIEELQRERLALTEMRAEYVRLCDQRDAAIARAEENKSAFHRTLDALDKANQEADTARAAHAEAIELLKSAENIEGNARECREWFNARDAHLAKYGKDSSK